METKTKYRYERYYEYKIYKRLKYNKSNTRQKTKKWEDEEYNCTHCLSCQCCRTGCTIMSPHPAGEAKCCPLNQLPKIRPCLFHLIAHIPCENIVELQLVHHHVRLAHLSRLLRRVKVGASHLQTSLEDASSQTTR